MEQNSFIPTNDYVFKRIFGHVGNEEITKGLLNAILDTKVKEIDLDRNTITEQDLYNDKVGILDVKATFNNDLCCDIEMQLTSQEKIEERLLFYWSKMYIKNIYKGQEYDKLKKCIVILIADFELDHLKKISKGHTEWKLKEKEFSKIVLTDVCEVHIIELPKLEKQAITKELSKKEEALLTWVKFFKIPERMGEIKMEDNENAKALKKAMEVYEELKQDEHEQYLAELRMKHIMDIKAVEAHGYKQGIEQAKIQMAKEMLKANEEIEKIVKYTGLDKKQIEELKK